MSWLEALVLGIVQGATEYLPVSSSGHLVIAQHLFGLRESVLIFDVVLHVGTLMAVLVYYRQEIVAMLRQSAAGLREIVSGGSPRESLQERPDFRLALLILLGTLPTAIIGVSFHDAFERAFSSVGLVGAMLVLTGAVLFVTRFVDRDGSRRLGPLAALVIGAVQGLAITPGISRSGTTIAAGMVLGIDRNEAVRFSFLLSVPSIVGALILEMDRAAVHVSAAALAIGFLAASAMGYACLAWLVFLVKKGKLHWFSYYCFALGLLTLALVA